MSTTIASAACGIILHNTGPISGAPRDHWCMPVGVVSGALTGTASLSQHGYGEVKLRTRQSRKRSQYLPRLLRRQQTPYGYRSSRQASLTLPVLQLFLLIAGWNRLEVERARQVENSTCVLVFELDNDHDGCGVACYCSLSSTQATEATSATSPGNIVILARRPLRRR